MKNKTKYVIFVLVLIILSILIYYVKTDKIFKLDESVYNLITLNMTNNKTLFFKIITNFASFWYILLFCILSLLFIKNKWIGIAISINSINSAMINMILKRIFVRPRPNVLRLVMEGGYSFPSGHAMASMSFYGFLIYLIYKSNIKKTYKIILIILLSILILLIGISRIYLGVHYTSDIICGYLVSIIYMFIYIQIICKIYYDNKNV